MKPSPSSCFVDAPPEGLTIAVFGPVIPFGAPYGFEATVPLYCRPGDTAAWLADWRCDCLSKGRNCVVTSLDAKLLGASRFSKDEVINGDSIVILRDIVGHDTNGRVIYRDVNLTAVCNEDWLLSGPNLETMFIHGDFDEWIWDGEAKNINSGE